jgi:hypothetical protein
MLLEIDNFVYQHQRSLGVRLEDLKNNPEKTISALCDWMDISKSETLFEMTAQGKRWWGDPSSPDYENNGMEPFGKTAINRKIGSIFSERDQFVLGTLFYPFSVRFGYTAEDNDKFKADLNLIRPMIDELFDFEKKLFKEKGTDAKEMMKNGSFMYFRAVLIERWNTLSECGTYPGMIEPLRLH